MINALRLMGTILTLLTSTPTTLGIYFAIQKVLYQLQPVFPLSVLTKDVFTRSQPFMTVSEACSDGYLEDIEFSNDLLIPSSTLVRKSLLLSIRARKEVSYIEPS